MMMMILSKHSSTISLELQVLLRKNSTSASLSKLGIEFEAQSRLL
jgi:hypothetical protein